MTSTTTESNPIGASATNYHESTSFKTHEDQLLQSAVQNRESSSSDDDDDDDDVDNDNDFLHRIPSGQSIMDYLSSLPNLGQVDRGRLLSRVGVEAKRKELGIYVGEDRAKDLNELEVKQMFNQLDNWKFSLVRSDSRIC